MKFLAANIKQLRSFHDDLKAGVALNPIVLISKMTLNMTSNNEASLLGGVHGGGGGGGVTTIGSHTNMSAGTGHSDSISLETINSYGKVKNDLVAISKEFKGLEEFTKALVLLGTTLAFREVCVL